MAHKTFISYKYSEAVELRDKIIKALGDDAQYYTGETSDSPDLTDTSTENIKRVLKDMIWGTSVTIVIASPNMKDSQWIDWEIEYSLKEIKRQDKTSRSNGVVIVAMKDSRGSYDWLIKKHVGDDGCSYITIDSSLLYDIINKNRLNKKKPKYTCENCKTVDALTGSYMSIIKEGAFLKDPASYIENAFKKAENISDYNITKER